MTYSFVLVAMFAHYSVTIPNLTLEDCKQAAAFYDEIGVPSACVRQVRDWGEAPEEGNAK